MAKVGLQLYTIKEETRRDFLGTLKRVADIGYDGVEFAGYFDTPPETLWAALAELSLAPAGSHVGLDRLEGDLAGEIAYAKAIGCPAIICPGFWGVDLTDVGTFVRLGDLFNQVGAQVKAAGLTFMYHVHGHEFGTFDGRYGLDVMLDRVEPAHMMLEPDTFWVEKAGVDMMAFLDAYGDRCAYFHLKDTTDRDDWFDTEIGAGALDMPAIVSRGQALGIAWYIVEQEKFERPMMDSIGISLGNIRGMLGA